MHPDEFNDKFLFAIFALFMAVVGLAGFVGFVEPPYAADEVIYWSASDAQEGSTHEL